MLDIIEQLLRAKLAVEKGETPQVTISLPLDDPRAQRLATLARRLLLPTTKIHRSGLVTKTGMVIPERADEFIGALRREVGDDIMGDLSIDLRAQIAARRAQAADDVYDEITTKPEKTARVIEEMLHNEEARAGIKTDTRQLFGNIAADMVQRAE